MTIPGVRNRSVDIPGEDARLTSGSNVETRHRCVLHVEHGTQDWHAAARCSSLLASPQAGGRTLPAPHSRMDGSVAPGTPRISGMENHMATAKPIPVLLQTRLAKEGKREQAICPRRLFALTRTALLSFHRHAAPAASRMSRSKRFELRFP